MVTMTTHRPIRRVGRTRVARGTTRPPGIQAADLRNPLLRPEPDTERSLKV